MQILSAGPRWGQWSMTPHDPCFSLPCTCFVAATAANGGGRRFGGSSASLRFHCAMAVMPSTEALCGVPRARHGRVRNYYRKWLWLSWPLTNFSFPPTGPLPPMRALRGMLWLRHRRDELRLKALAPRFRKQSAPPENFSMEHGGTPRTCECVNSDIQRRIRADGMVVADLA